MLSTFLSQLQSYFSKYFVLGSFCPVLAFAFLNGLTAYFVSRLSAGIRQAPHFKPLS